MNYLKSFDTWLMFWLWKSQDQGVVSHPGPKWFLEGTFLDFQTFLLHRWKCAIPESCSWTGEDLSLCCESRSVPELWWHFLSTLNDLICLSQVFFFFSWWATTYYWGRQIEIARKQGWQKAYPSILSYKFRILRKGQTEISNLHVSVMMHSYNQKKAAYKA